MDGSRFDILARSFATSGTRRRLLSRLLGGVVLGAPLALLGQGEASADCNADRRRGDACTDKCQCRGDFRCGAPRLEDQRAECGQNEDPDLDPDPDLKVCCLGQGDSCHNNNDCECCGTLSCHLGRYRVRDGATCARGKVHHLGACIGNGVCGPGTDGQSDCGPATCGRAEFGQDARSGCATTAEGGRVCVGVAFDTDVFRPCKQSADCPADYVCLPISFNPPTSTCFPVCGS
jgi:hypothetical protein